MQEKIKTYLYLTIIIGIFSFVVGFYLFLSLQYKNYSPVRTFSVSAEGKVNAIPDIAEIRLTVISEGKDLANIQKENSEKINRIINFLKEKGIKDEDIKTEIYNLQPKYDWQKSPYQIVGYTLNQTILVKIRDFNKIGEILSEAVKYGANQISGPNFTIDDPEKLKEEAREMAIKKAKEKAEKIAKAANVKLGELFNISEYGLIPSPIVPLYKSLEATSEEVIPQIEPGSQKIKVTVTLTYEIR